jgi:hypothetical protein
MAKFGQGFIQSLTQPGYSQGLFELGTALGQAPAVAAEKKAEKDRLARLDESFAKTMQGTAAAQQGDVAAVTRRMRELQSSMRLAKTTEEKSIYMKEIQSLQALVPGAQKTQQANQIKAVSSIDTTLENLDVSTDQGKLLKETLTNRKNELLKDPDVQQGYRKAQVDAFRFEEEERSMLQNQYLKTNQNVLLTAVRTKDQAEIDRVLSEVPDEFAGVASDFVAGAIRNENVLTAFNQTSTDLKSKPLTKAELDTIIADLPEEVKKTVAAELAAYEEAAKSWSPENGWSGNTKALGTLKQAEAALRKKVSTVGTQYIFNEIDQQNRIKNQEAVLVRSAQLAFEDTPSESSVVSRAKQDTTERDGEPTRQEYLQARADLISENQDKQLRIINRYDPDLAEEMGYAEDEKMSIEEATELLNKDPSEENQAFYIIAYGQEAFDENFKGAVSSKDPSALETAFVTPVVETAKFVSESVEPVSKAITLASARRTVGEAFNKYGGLLREIPLEVLELVANDKGFSKKNRDKINAEIDRRRGDS